MSDHARDDSSPFAPHWARRIAVGCSLAAGVVLLSWLTGNWQWLALGERFVPIAPGTAVLSLLVAGSIWLRTSAPIRPQWPSQLFAGVTILLALLVAIARLRGIPLEFERLLSGTEDELRGVTLGRVSEYTAGFFVLLGAALVLPASSARSRQMSAILAAASNALAVLVLHGYFLGAPVLYEGSSIPVAATTAALVLALGGATMMLAGAGAWPLSVFVSDGRLSTAVPGRRSFAIFVALLAGFVLTSGYFWYRAERSNAIRSAMRLHEVVADLKSQEIAAWYAHRLALARSMQATSMVDGDLQSLTADANSARLRARTLQWIGAVQGASGAESMSLHTADGRMLAVAPESFRSTPTLELARILTLPVQEGVFVDEAELGSDQRVILWVPIGVERRGNPRSWLALSMNVREALRPLLAGLPALGPSSEAILWRRDGQSAESITNMRGGVATPGSVRLSLERDSLTPVARGYLGERGVIEGPDYLGIPVAAIARGIAGTDWMLILKSDQAELTRPLQLAALRSTLSALILVFALTIAIFALWYRRDLVATRRELDLLQGHDSDVVRMTQLDRMLRMRSAIDVALVRAGDEHELLQAACDAAVISGGYRMAWVGLAEHDAGRTMRPVAISGDELGYLTENRVSWSADEPAGLGPVGRCVRTGSLQTVQDVQVERTFDPWRDAARKRGYHALCAIPLKVRGEVVGALAVYSAESYNFHDEEISLLGDVGDDLSFGLTALRDGRVHRERETQLAFFREVMERSNDAIYVMDATTGAFIDFNQTALRSLGYTADELRALHPKDIVPDIADLGEERRRFDQVWQGEVTTRRSMTRRKDGSTFPVEFSLTALEMAGRRLVLSIARDITDRVRDETERDRLQAQFLRAQRMESVGRLAGGVAHDFNNLLTVINGTADLALADLAPDSPIRADLADIRSAGQRAASLTRQLLAFSRQQVLRAEHLELNEVVRGFSGMLKRVIGEDCVVELRLGSAAADVVADRGQLEQVLMNLCVNARDAMPGGGCLTLGVEVANVNEAQASQIPTMTPGRYVTLSVADTGEGMSPVVQARLFEPFFTTKEPGRGTGLGLSTVYGIVKQSGGHIGLISSPGHGTKFNIYLPVAQAGVDPVSATPRAKPSTGSETILVVEDEEAIRFVVRRVLERSGYKVLEAPTGADALQVIRAHHGPLDLVMTDLVMPGMSGIELARLLRREHPSLRILLASGYSQDTVSSEFDTAHEWQLISKPYSLKDLLLEIRRALDGPEPTTGGGMPA